MSIVMPGDELRERTIRLDGSETGWQPLASGLVVPAYAAPLPPPRRPIGVDLFCGAGGFSCGFHETGWHVAAAAEAWPVAALTYLANLGGPDTRVVVLADTPFGDGRKRKFIPEGEYRAGDMFEAAGTGWIASDHCDKPDACLLPCEVFYLGDVGELAGEQILHDLGVDEVDCVFGGPPCQGFSTANGKSSDEARHDPRNLLVFEFARLVLECNARTFVIENVPRMVTMLTAEGLPILDVLCQMLADGGMGTMAALKRSLLASSGTGTGAAVRGHGQAGAVDPDEDEVAPR